MRRRPLVRLGGLATVVSGVLFAGPTLLGFYPQIYERLPLPDEVTLWVVGLVLLPVGLALSDPLPFSSIFIVFGLAWFALGFALASRRVDSTEQLFGVG